MNAAGCVVGLLRRGLITGVCLLTAPAGALHWEVGEGETCQLGGSNVFETVSIGANATVGLTGDTVLIVTGTDEPGPAFYMGTGATICAALEVPRQEAKDGTDGEVGIDGEWGSFSNFVYFPYNPPTYYPPNFIDAEDGRPGTDATAASPHDRMPNLWIRVDGDVLLDSGSEISVSTFADAGSHLVVDGGNGGRGGNGGNGGGYQEFRTSGDLSKPYHYYGFYTNDPGDGGGGGAAGRAAHGAPGPAGGELRLHATGKIQLAGEVSLSANGFEGGDGGNAGNGGFPGTPAPGHRDIGPDGDYRHFGANGAAGNGAPGRPDGPLQFAPVSVN